jgi:hypothetical protein
MEAKQYSIEIDFEAWAAEWEVRMDKLIAAGAKK